MNQYLPGTIQIPSSLLVTAATKAFPMVITVAIGNSTDEVNTYIEGMCVKLYIPRPYGMFQANGLTGKIISINGSDWSLDIDSTGFDSFSIPAGNAQTPASVSPAGSRNLQYTNNTEQVPFQSYNNVGN